MLDKYTYLKERTYIKTLLKNIILLSEEYKNKHIN